MSKQFEQEPICHDSRECFAASYRKGEFRVCLILSETYKNDGECPYCKKERGNDGIHGCNRGKG